MGQSLQANTAVGRQRFEEADRLLGRSLSGICFAGPEEELKRSANTQPALLLVSAILADMLHAGGIKPQAYAGHSLGEYSALYAAGAMDFATALKLVALRGDEMSKAAERQPGSMAAIIGIDREVVQACCAEAGGQVAIANDNCQGQLVISGESEAVARACEIAKSKKARRAMLLPVQGAYHSPLMESAVAPMREALEAATIVSPATQVIANVTAQPHATPAEIRFLLSQQITAPVRWTETIARLAGEGFDTFIEVGQGNVLAGLVKRTAKDAEAISVQNETDVAAAVAKYAGQ